MDQPARHRHQYVGVFEVVPIELVGNIHLDHIKPPATAQRALIALEFGGFAAAGMAKEQDVLLRIREELCIIAQAQPQLARQQLLRAFGATRALGLHVAWSSGSSASSKSIFWITSRICVGG